MIRQTIGLHGTSAIFVLNLYFFLLNVQELQKFGIIYEFA